MPEYQIVMRSGPFAGKIFPVTGDMVTLGREPGNTIVVNDAEISRRHARLVLQGNSYMIEDLGSTNGTFINGSRISGPHPLHGGEVISFGEQISCLFEAIVAVDPNATVMHAPKPVIPAVQPVAPISRPVPEPAPAKVPPPLSPEPSFAKQIPAGPMAPPPPPPSPVPSGKRSGMVVAIVAIVLIVCIFCGCLGFFWWIDSDPTGARWCDILPFVVNLIGGTCQ